MSSIAPQGPQAGHIGLNVTNLERSASFYCRLFGFKVTSGSNVPGRRFAYLSSNGRVVLTLWQQSEGSFATNAPGLHHLAFEVGSLEEVRAAEQTLYELGARLHYRGVVPHGEGTESGGIYFTDPDGIRVEVYASTGADRTAAQPPAPGWPSCGFF